MDLKSFHPIPSKSPIHDPPDFLNPSHLSQDIQGGLKSHDTILLHHLCQRRQREHAKIVFHPLPSPSQLIAASFRVPWDSRGSKMTSSELWRLPKGAYLAPCTRCSKRIGELGKKSGCSKLVCCPQTRLKDASYCKNYVFNIMSSYLPFQ